jgi:hypothetical protein
MSVVARLGIVSGIVSILAFVFAVWVWIKSDAKVRELEGVIQSVYDVTGTIVWDMQTVHAEDPATRLRNAENSLSKISTLRIVTGKYSKSTNSLRHTEIGVLLERGIIWTDPMIWSLEMSESVREIWLVTPDLEPDLSEATTGRMVAANLKARKRYVYFCPNNISDFENQKRRLLANIGALRPQEASRVTIVPISPSPHSGILQRGNTIILFSEDPAWGTYNAFEEVVFTKISTRGIFWQEHKPSVAGEIRAALKQELDDWRTRSPR